MNSIALQKEIGFFIRNANMACQMLLVFLQFVEIEFFFICHDKIPVIPHHVMWAILLFLALR